MHVVFRESHGLEGTETPFDLGQDPADLVGLSFSDSDLGALAAGWHRAKATAPLPTLRLANLVALKHPLSVDTWAERTLPGVKGVLVRVIGGEAYWTYGLATLADLARKRGFALAVLPADGRPDARLDELSTLPVSTLRRLSTLMEAGGAVAAQAALAQLALAAGLYAGPVAGTKSIPDFGLYDPAAGVVSAPPEGPLALVTFYRSYLTAADTAPIDALIDGLRARGLAAIGAFATSLKASGFRDWLAATLPRAPDLIVNATAFSAKGEDGTTPFDGWSCPVFQVALSTARRRDWAASDRGLSPADLAMHVVLPEVDGRLFAGLISHKSPGKRDPDLQFSRFAHRPDPQALDAALNRILAHVRLARTAVGHKRLAIILSSYPGRAHNLAHAVGLDALASTEALLTDLASTGHDCAPFPNLATQLHFLSTNIPRGEEPGSPNRAPWGREAPRPAPVTWPLAQYRQALATLPAPLRDQLHAAWGAPEDDPAVIDGAFHFPALHSSKVIVALQPERGEPRLRDAEYHDLARVPRHAYVAFYLWLRSQGIIALIHMGAHGTLEWLPGKSVALGPDCWPQALTGPLPVLYPFIVNDPGEAAQAKRRIGALTIGHLPPPLAEAALPETLASLERLLDEYSTADGLDPARRDRLIADIRAEARASGVEEDLGLPQGASTAEAITRIDRFVCDLKESRYGEGLHVFGRGDCGQQERDGLMAALAGRKVPPGPAGSPNRGRSDVLPTGRNLFAVDPRAVPTKGAHAQGVKMAEELLRRHLQDQGDWPKGLIVDLWGSATMRTAGEDFAMALHLAGLTPNWDAASGRVSGFTIIPSAELGRPRIDVTLRVSGLFRDIFPGLAQLFEAGAQALAARDWEGHENPYIAREARVFGPKPGSYGLGMGTMLDDFTEESRAAAGEAWLNASSFAIGADGQSRPDRKGIEARVKGADAFVHAQDLAESDVLLAADYAAHEAGVAAAARVLTGKAPALYHLDITRADAPRARSLTEEIARVVRARAANPAWAGGMMRHGFRGGAEIAATLEHLAAFAHLAGVVPSHLFDLYHGATLGRDEVRDFLARENPGALASMEDLFRRLAEAGLWITRRNSIAMALETGR